MQHKYILRLDGASGGEQLQGEKGVWECPYSCSLQASMERRSAEAWFHRGKESAKQC